MVKSQSNQEADNMARKAATVIVALGSDKASKVYKYMKQDEIEQLTIDNVVRDEKSTSRPKKRA